MPSSQDVVQKNYSNDIYESRSTADMSQNGHPHHLSKTTVREMKTVTRWVLRKVGDNRVLTPLVFGGMTAATLLIPNQAPENHADNASSVHANEHIGSLKKTAFAVGSGLTVAAVALGPQAKRILVEMEKSISQAL